MESGSGSTPSEFVRELVRESSSTATPRRQDRLTKALLTRKPIRDAPVLEVLEPNLRRRIDQKLLAALDRGEALPGEHVMPELRKKHQARA
jgi:hypothetical protein